MWELYAFWAFVPFILQQYNNHIPDLGFPVSILSFIIIAIGGIACVLGGYIAQRTSAKRTAGWALALSGLCCLLFPFVFYHAHPITFLLLLIFWGLFVIADSPLFSSLVAHNAPPEHKGSALTLVNCLGFAISIVSIQLLTFLSEHMNSLYFIMLLAIGPCFGLLSIFVSHKKAHQ